VHHPFGSMLLLSDVHAEVQRRTLIFLDSVKAHSIGIYKVSSTAWPRATHWLEPTAQECFSQVEIVSKTLRHSTSTSTLSNSIRNTLIIYLPKLIDALVFSHSLFYMTGQKYTPPNAHHLLRSLSPCTTSSRVALG
jgi:hypothetical protein